MKNYLKKNRKKSLKFRENSRLGIQYTFAFIQEYGLQ